jgi:hypothetical protein
MRQPHNFVGLILLGLTPTFGGEVANLTSLSAISFVAEPNLVSVRLGFAIHEMDLINIHRHRQRTWQEDWHSRIDPKFLEYSAKDSNRCSGALRRGHFGF